LPQLLTEAPELSVAVPGCSSQCFELVVALPQLLTEARNLAVAVIRGTAEPLELFVALPQLVAQARNLAVAVIRGTAERLELFVALPQLVAQARNLTVAIMGGAAEGLDLALELGDPLVALPQLLTEALDLALELLAPLATLAELAGEPRSLVFLAAGRLAEAGELLLGRGQLVGDLLVEGDCLAECKELPFTLAEMLIAATQLLTEAFQLDIALAAGLAHRLELPLGFGNQILCRLDLVSQPLQLAVVFTRRLSGGQFLLELLDAGIALVDADNELLEPIV